MRTCVCLRVGRTLELEEGLIKAIKVEKKEKKGGGLLYVLSLYFFFHMVCIMLRIFSFIFLLHHEFKHIPLYIYTHITRTVTVRCKSIHIQYQIVVKYSN